MDDEEPEEGEDDGSDNSDEDEDTAEDEPLPNEYIDLLARELPDPPQHRISLDEMFADYADEVRRRSRGTTRRRLPAAEAEHILRNLRVRTRGEDEPTNSQA